MVAYFCPGSIYIYAIQTQLNLCLAGSYLFVCLFIRLLYIITLAIIIIIFVFPFVAIPYLVCNLPTPADISCVMFLMRCLESLITSPRIIDWYVTHYYSYANYYYCFLPFKSNFGMCFATSIPQQISLNPRRVVCEMLRVFDLSAEFGPVCNLCTNYVSSSLPFYWKFHIWDATCLLQQISLNLLSSLYPLISLL